MHIHLYFDDPACQVDVDGLDASDKGKLQEKWKSVLDEANKSNVVLTVEVQRIIISTVAYILFDLMCTK